MIHFSVFFFFFFLSYLVENEKQTSERRLLVAKLRDDLAQLERELEAVSNYKESKQSLANILNLAQMHIGETNPDLAMAVFKFSQQASEREASLRKRILDVQQTIKHAYDDFPQRHVYALHAILVHR